MADDKEILIAIKVDNTEAQKRIDDQTEAIIDLKKANQLLKKSNKETKDGEKLSADQRRINTEAIARNSLKISEATKIRRNAINSQKAENGSLTNLRNTLSTLTATRNKDLAVGSDAFNKANEDIKGLTTTIKEAEQGGDDFRRSVGKYPNTFKDAAGAMAGFGNSTDGATGSFDALGKVIKLSPLGILISLLVAMVAAFSQTEEGAKKLKIIMAVLSSIFKDLVSLLASGGKVIVEFFENPLKSIKEFGNTLTNFVKRRVEELLIGLGELGSAISKLFSGDFTGALEDAKKGALNLTTSIIPVAGIIKDLAPAVKEYTENLVENAKETVKLTTANYDLQRSLLATEKQIVKLQGQEAVLASQSEDSTISFIKQREAQDELIKVQERRFNLQQNLLSKQIKIIQSELNLAKNRNQQTLEIEQRLTEKQKELITNRNEQRLEETNNIKIARQRDQDEWEQGLDFIIDVGEKRRVKFEEAALNENNSLDVRTKALQDYQDNLAKFLQTQKNSFAEQGLSEEEFDRLLGIKDPAKLAEAITGLDTLSEIQKNRLREVFIEFEDGKIEEAEVLRKFAEITIKIDKDKEDAINQKRDESAKKEEARLKKEADLRKQLAGQTLNTLSTVFRTAGMLAANNFKLQKAFAIAEAVVNTAKGVSQALGSAPPPLSFVTAAAVGVAGAIQVANIAKTTPNTGGAGNVSIPSLGSVDTSQPTADTSQADNAQSQSELLANALNNQGLQVSVTEINEVQNRVQVTDENAQI